MFPRHIHLLAVEVLVLVGSPTAGIDLVGASCMGLQRCVVGVAVVAGCTGPVVVVAVRSLVVARSLGNLELVVAVGCTVLGADSHLEPGVEGSHLAAEEGRHRTDLVAVAGTPVDPEEVGTAAAAEGTPALEAEDNLDLA